MGHPDGCAAALSVPRPVFVGEMAATGEGEPGSGCFVEKQNNRFKPSIASLWQRYNK